MTYNVKFISRFTRAVLDEVKKDFPNYADAAGWAVRECLVRGDDFIYAVSPKNGLV